MAQEFLNLIFVADSSKRASIDELWNHPWMQGRTLQEAELTEVSALTILALSGVVLCCAPNL